MAMGDNFMWFPGSSDIAGETTDTMFSQRDAFELFNFTFSLTCEESTDGKGGVGANAGKAKFAGVTVDKFLDAASAGLYKACSKGTIFPNVMMAIRRAGGDPILYVQYIFRYNQITSLTWTGGSGTERVKETMILTFKAMGLQYIQVKDDGTLAAGKKWFWNTVDQGKGGSGTPSLEIPGLPPAPMFLPGTDFRK